MNRSAHVAQPGAAAGAARDGLLRRQCDCGAHTLGASTCSACGKRQKAEGISGIQAKLRLGAVDDPLEAEADRISEQVLAAPQPGMQGVQPAPPAIQRVAGTRGQVASEAATASVEPVLGASGAPLEPGLRQDMEGRFGSDFSGVRVHADGAAQRSAQEIDARAYTAGNHVVFGAGQFAPASREGRRLIAHELTHVVQQQGHAAGGAAPVLRRSPVPGSVGWQGATGPNKKQTTVKGIERIPLDGLGVGHQGGGGLFSGKAIVLMPPGLDPAKPVDVLLHFHGHNAGHAEAGAKARDDTVDNIEAQLAASSRPQLMAILPQGTPDSAFGTAAQSSDKAFDPDAYVNNIFAVLSNNGIWNSAPTLAGVMISGHSGAGELINEKILGAGLGSNIGAGASPTGDSAAPAAFKELALIDAVNGPREHARLYEFLQMKMTDELAKAQQKGSDDEKIAYLKGGFKFRGYYSHDNTTRNFYSQWYVGKVVNPKAVYKDSIQEMINKFLTANKAALGGAGSRVYNAFKANYQIKDAGAVAHIDMVSLQGNLEDAVSVLPRHEDGVPDDQPAAVPRAVVETLQSSGRPLDDASLAWANRAFGRDLGAVRIHDDRRAAESARAIQAKAYTAGRDVVFGAGRYAPHTGAGRRLLAHELAHVVQQVQARPSPSSSPPLGARRDAFEAQAERMAEAANESAAAPAAARALSAGAAVPAIQRAPDDTKTVDAAMCEANANPHPAALSDCSYKTPENCPTYEGWISSFTLLKSNNASDTPGTKASGINVIGGGSASQDFRKVAKEPGPPPHKPFAPLKPGERFIDHPTDAWVRNCLPENLRATAYQLPADCADIAMILRHVWLAAHHRTQKFGTWILGDEAGRASEKNVMDVITNAGTEQVANLVAPYSDGQGRPLRSIKQLAPLLHPGDILVWWHYDKGFDKGRTGGHTHTIGQVERDNTGALVDLTLLQGNEPLFQPQKDEIRDFLTAENPKQKRPDDKTLGSAPGRRIEKATAGSAGLEFKDSDPGTDKSPAPIWKWGAETLLVAAGPPKSAPRPPAVKKKGEKGPAARRLTDWAGPLRGAAATELVAKFESMLFEARAAIEVNGALIESEARAVGAAAGARIWELGKQAKDLGNASHFKPLQDVMDILWAFQNSREIVSRKADTQYDDITFRLFTQFDWIKQAFEAAARGITDISFATAGKDDTVKVLVTGFDPFEPTGSLRRPGAGEWNPSGAAALALDGQRLPVAGSKGGKGSAAVESMVLPVSYEAFKSGIVEQAIGPHAKEVDAVLTVSEDAGLDPSQPVRLERYAVGVHHIYGNLEGVPAAGAGGAGAAIIESPAPLKDIAANTEVPARKGSVAVPKPSIGEGVTFEFKSATEADAALAALGLPAGRAAQVVISDENALHQIVSGMTRKGDSAQIAFKAGAKSFSAKIVQGPGGNFLSNEVSLRALRLLGASSSARDPISFHTHTQRSDAIAADDGSAAGKKAHKEGLAKAMGLLGKIVATLKRIIGAVGRAVLDKRSASRR